MDHSSTPLFGAPASDGAAPALIDAKSGTILSYEGLGHKRAAFIARLTSGKGLFLLIGSNSINAITAYLAALASGCPVILLDEKARQHRESFLAQFSILYAYDPATDALEVFADNTGLQMHPDLALMLSTSGSTGAKKFVRLSRQNLASNAQAIADYLALTADDRAPTALPMSYSFGLSVINSHLTVGASVLVTGKSAIDPSFWEDVDRHKVTSFSGVPQSYALLEQTGLADRTKPSIRYMTQAGGKLAAEKVTAWAKRGQAEGWDFFVMYGQTEAAPRIAYLPPAQALRHPGAIGYPVPGGHLHVVDETGAPCPPGTEGELIYRGPNVMMGYATSDADLALPQGPDTLKTGDMGIQDAQGLTTITGRRARFIKLSGKRIGLEAVEAWLVGQGVTGAAVGRDEALGLLLPAGADEGLADILTAELDVPRSTVHAVAVDALPFNQNGKLDLKAANALLEAHLARATPRKERLESADQSLIEAAILEIFTRQFPGRDIRATDSFQSLGGSSNAFVETEIALEERLGGLPTNWHVYAIGDLAAAAASDAPPRRDPFDRIAARALCALLVVAHHVIGHDPSAGLGLAHAHPLAVGTDILYYLRMPFFAFLAGLAFVQMGGETLSPKAHFTNIGRSLAVPSYFSIALFAVVATVTGTAYAMDTVTEALRLLVYPYAHYWFMLSLMMQLAVFYLVLRLVPPNWTLWVLLAAIALPVLIQGEVPGDLFSVNGAIALAPFFALGVLFARHIDWVLAQRRLLLIGAGVLALALLALVIQERLSELDAQPLFGRRSLVMLGLGASLIPFCMILAGWLPGLRWLAPFTFYIYLWHPMATSATRRLLEALGIAPDGGLVAVHLIAGVGIGVAVPLAMVWVLSRLPGGNVILGRSKAAPF